MADINAALHEIVRDAIEYECTFILWPKELPIPYFVGKQGKRRISFPPADILYETPGC